MTKKTGNFKNTFRYPNIRLMHTTFTDLLKVFPQKNCSGCIIRVC